MLFTSCIIIWTLCLTVFGYEIICYAFTGIWTPVTLYSVYDVLGRSPDQVWDLLPAELAVKTLFGMSFIRLDITLWWLGLAFCVASTVATFIYKRRI